MERRYSQYPVRETWYARKQKYIVPGNTPDTLDLPKETGSKKGNFPTLIWIAVALWLTWDYIPWSTIGENFRQQEVTKPPPPSPSIKNRTAINKPNQVVELQQLLRKGRGEILKRNFAKGEKLLRQALPMAQNLPRGKTGSSFLSTLRSLVRALEGQKKYDLAISMAEEYQQLLASGKGDTHLQPQPLVYLQFASLYRKAGRYQQAVNACETALIKAASNSNWSRLAPTFRVYFNMVLIYQDWKRPNMAKHFAQLTLTELENDIRVQPRTREHFRKMVERILQRIERPENIEVDINPATIQLPD